jgi:GST-like protein
MIDLYSYGTINGQNIVIALEEMQLEYNLHKVDLMTGEQRTPEFLKLNPSGRIPTIIDHDNDLILTQSSAILIYLAEKSGKLLSKETILKAKTLEWMMFHATDLAPNIFNNFYLKALIKQPQPIAAKYIKDKYLKLYSYFNDQLSNHQFLNGFDYSIADIAAYPAIYRLIDTFEDLKYHHIIRWFELVSKRPAVTKGISF